MEQDSKPKRGKAFMPVTKAPQGNVKGIGKLGNYLGGLVPLVVAPQSGLNARSVAPLLGRVSGNVSIRKR